MKGWRSGLCLCHWKCRGDAYGLVVQGGGKVKVNVAHRKVWGKRWAGFWRVFPLYEVVEQCSLHADNNMLACGSVGSNLKAGQCVCVVLGV